MQNQAEQIADECIRRTGARRISSHAKQVALVALMLVPGAAIDAKDYRHRVRMEVRRRNEFGSIVLFLVLPILINLITAWIIRWMANRSQDGQLRRLRAEAFDAL